LLHLYYCSFLVFSFFLVITIFFFFNDTPTTEIYTLSLHDALPIYSTSSTKRANESESRSLTTPAKRVAADSSVFLKSKPPVIRRDRKSTRLNSSHLVISYAVFCLKKKKKKIK